MTHLPIQDSPATGRVHAIFAHLLTEAPAIFQVHGILAETIRVIAKLLSSSDANESDKHAMRSFIVTMGNSSATAAPLQALFMNLKEKKPKTFVKIITAVHESQ
jgi:hypothetical protein